MNCIWQHGIGLHNLMGRIFAVAICHACCSLQKLRKVQEKRLFGEFIFTKDQAFQSCTSDGFVASGLRSDE